MTAHEKYLEAIKAHPTSKAERDAHDVLARAAMQELGVERVTDLHPLKGATVIYDGHATTIIFAMHGKFMSRSVHPLPVEVVRQDKNGTRYIAEIEDYREPHGLIKDLVDNGDGTFTYTTPEG